MRGEKTKFLWQNPEYRKYMSKVHKGKIPFNKIGKFRKVCIVCKKVFEVHNYRRNTARYCSPNCRHKDMKGKCSNTGRTHFKKGQTAWNKDTKGICKSNSGSFKKGHIPWLKGTKGLVKPNKGSFKKGKEHPQYKEVIYHQGYAFIHMPNHPFTRRGKYIKRSRYNVEKYLKRFLSRTEKTHHINGIRDDDRLENLMAFVNQSAHRRFHVNPNFVKSSEIIFDGRKL